MLFPTWANCKVTGDNQTTKRWLLWASLKPGDSTKLIHEPTAGVGLSIMLITDPPDSEATETDVCQKGVFEGNEEYIVFDHMGNMLSNYIVGGNR